MDMYNLFKPTHWRYERKFFLYGITRHETESVVRLHPAMFSEIFSERTVNNLYLDFFDKRNYMDNVVGHSQRVKVRLRWYGELFGHIEKPVLEVKIKSGQLGSKLAYPLGKGLHLCEEFSVHKVRELLHESEEIPGTLKAELMGFELSLLNNYRRRYFQSADRKFRITVDTNMRWYRVSQLHNRFLESRVDQKNAILELKYKADQDVYAERITNSLPFRMTKSSKYVTGITTFEANEV